MRSNLVTSLVVVALLQAAPGCVDRGGDGFETAPELVEPPVVQPPGAAGGAPDFGAPGDFEPPDAPGDIDILAAPLPPYTRTIIVNSTGNATADGAALLAALTGISPAPSYTERWLIQLETGIYDVADTPVVMQEYVDIAGSGRTNTVIRGSVGPPPGFFTGGLIQGASNTELRNLTVACNSSTSQQSCQGISLENASPRLTGMTVLVQGSGTDTHTGIRTINSAPILDRVLVRVTSPTSTTNHGIVYGGASTANITRSDIVVRNATVSNRGLVFKEELTWSQIQDSNINVVGGNSAVGIVYLESITSNPLLCDNVRLSAHGATTSTGIGSINSSGMPRIWFRGGRVFGGDVGIDCPGAKVFLSHTEVQGTSATLIEAVEVGIGATWLRGGSIVALTAACAGVIDENFVFFPDTCP